MREFNRVMRGYSREDVDELFARIDAGQITADELRSLDLRKQMMGYEPAVVDREINEALRALEA